MQIDGNTIKFKSDKKSFFIEESGAKQNTVRFLQGYETVELDHAELDYIQITHADPALQRTFTRRLTNIMQIGKMLGGELYVFSWRDDDVLWRAHGAMQSNSYGEADETYKAMEEFVELVRGV